MSKTLMIVIAVTVVGYIIFNFIGSKKAAENIKAGEEFLAENGVKDGIESTRSGLQYQVINKGTGKVHPRATDKVKVHYQGSLIDGTVFESSVERGEPIEFPLNRVIKGWTEGVQLMVVGEKTRFFIPSNLGYGNRSSGPIPAGALLIFEIELLEIK